MKKYLFYDFKAWLSYMKASVKRTILGICQIMYGIIMGIVSVFAYIGRQIEDFCKRETFAAIIIGIVICILAGGWLFSFVVGRASIKKVEAERDSISLKYSKYMQAYDTTDMVIVYGDTIKYSYKQ